MANQVIGRLGSIGIGIEATPGTPVAASVYVPYIDSTVRERHTPLPIVSAMTDRIADENSVNGKHWGEGDFGLVADIVNSGYLWKMALGQELYTAGTPSTHQFFTTVSGNTPTTATIIYSRSADVIQLANSACEKLTFSFKDGLVDMKMTVKSQQPTIVGSQTATTTSGTFLAFKDATFKLGPTLGSLGAATPINEFALEINNNLDLVYQTGNQSPTLVLMKQVTIKGSFSKLFDDVTERNAFTALTKRALELNLVGNANESLRIRIPQFRNEDSDVTTALDNFYMVKTHFVAEDLTDSSTAIRYIEVRLQNNKTSVY